MKPQLFILHAKRLQHIIIEISDVAESKFHNCEEKQEIQKEKVKCLSNPLIRISMLEINNLLCKHKTSSKNAMTKTRGKKLFKTTQHGLLSSLLVLKWFRTLEIADQLNQLDYRYGDQLSNFW